MSKVNYRELADCKKAAALKLCKQIAEAIETGENLWNIESMTACLNYEVEQFKFYNSKANTTK